MKKFTNQSPLKNLSDKMGKKFGKNRKTSSYVVRSDSFVVVNTNPSSPPKRLPAKNKVSEHNNNSHLSKCDVKMLENTLQEMRKTKEVSPRKLAVVHEEIIVPQTYIPEGELDSTIVHVSLNEDLRKFIS